MYIREHTRYSVSFVPPVLWTSEAAKTCGTVLPALNGRRLLWFGMFGFVILPPPL